MHSWPPPAPPGWPGRVGRGQGGDKEGTRRGQGGDKEGWGRAEGKEARDVGVHTAGAYDAYYRL